MFARENLAKFTSSIKLSFAFGVAALRHLPAFSNFICRQTSPLAFWAGFFGAHCRFGAILFFSNALSFPI
jgi:hypothetical protein